MDRRLIVGLTLVALLCVGCASRVGTLTIVSSRNVNLEGLARARTGNEIRVSARDVCHIILIFPVTGAGNIQDAIDKAIDEGKGDVLMDAAVYQYWWYIPLIYGQFGWRVKGIAVNSNLAAPRS